MADRICSLCGQGYTDEEGHDYDICVSRCSDYLETAKANAHNAVDILVKAHTHYHEAVNIQKQDWWRKKKE